MIKNKKIAVIIAIAIVLIAVITCVTIYFTQSEPITPVDYTGIGIEFLYKNEDYEIPFVNGSQVIASKSKHSGKIIPKHSSFGKPMKYQDYIDLLEGVEPIDGPFDIGYKCNTIFRGSDFTIYNDKGEDMSSQLEDAFIEDIEDIDEFYEEGTYLCVINATWGLASQSLTNDYYFQFVVDTDLDTPILGVDIISEGVRYELPSQLKYATTITEYGALCADGIWLGHKQREELLKDAKLFVEPFEIDLKDGGGTYTIYANSDERLVYGANEFIMPTEKGIYYGMVSSGVSNGYEHSYYDYFFKFEVK